MTWQFIPPLERQAEALFGRASAPTPTPASVGALPNGIFRDGSNLGAAWSPSNPADWSGSGEVEPRNRGSVRLPWLLHALLPALPPDGARWGAVRGEVAGR